MPPAKPSRAAALRRIRLFLRRRPLLRCRLLWSLLTGGAPRLPWSPLRAAVAHRPLRGRLLRWRPFPSSLVTGRTSRLARCLLRPSTGAGRLPRSRLRRELSKRALEIVEDETDGRVRPGRRRDPEGAVADDEDVAFRRRHLQLSQRRLTRAD